MVSLQFPTTRTPFLREEYLNRSYLSSSYQRTKSPAHYRFVVVKADETDTVFEFKEYSVEEFMQYSTIPPFKVYFNVPVDGSEAPLRKREGETRAVLLTKEGFNKLMECYESLK